MILVWRKCPITGQFFTTLVPIYVAITEKLERVKL